MQRDPRARLFDVIDAAAAISSYGMRNVLVHGYDIVDYGLVWKAIHQDLPRLSTTVTALLTELDAAAESQSAPSPDTTGG